MYRRLCNPSNSRSFFLFGSRGTGKSSLIREHFKGQNILNIDLLRPQEFDILNRDPEELTRRIEAFSSPTPWIILDEVQKIPKILDLVHYHIEQKKVKFALTGSSARKLKRGSANLLAGRALVYSLFPLTSIELEKDFSLEHALQWGTLPEIINEKDAAIKRKILEAYTHTYLREEIQQEQLIRSLDPFHQFLAIAGQMNGKIINYSKIASECGASDHSVREYFRILEDTLLGFHLPAYHESIRKRQRQNPKFFIFDNGVARSLASHLQIPVVSKTSAYGEAFETWLINEIMRLSVYNEKDFSLSYLRTKDDAEIDLIIERPGMPRALIEIKSSTSVKPEDVSMLNRFVNDMKKAEAFCLSLDPAPKKIGNVNVLPWERGLREIGVT